MILNFRSYKLCSRVDVYVETYVYTDLQNGTNGTFVAARINSGGCYTAGGKGVFFYVFPSTQMYQLWGDAGYFLYLHPFLPSRLFCLCKFDHFIYHLRALSFFFYRIFCIKWARSCKNMSYAICEQQRCRSACVSARSDQHLCCSLLKQYDMYTCYIQSFKVLASFCN